MRARRALAFVLLACLLAGCGTRTDRRGSGTGASGSGAASDGAHVQVDVAVLSSLQRLIPASDDDGAARTIHLEAARGEREGAQLVARARRGAPRLVLVTAALRGARGATIPADDVTAYIEQPMRVRHGSPAGRSGAYVDPLVPAERRDVVLGPDDRLLAWVDVAVATDATPGTYRGAVELRAATRSGEYATGEDGLLASVPVELVVHRAVLPERPTLGSSIGVDASQLVRFEDVAAGSPELRRTMDRYAQVLADARLSIADVGTVPPGTLAGAPGVAADGTYLERVWTRRGVASIRVPMYLTYPFADPTGNDRPAAVAYLRSVARWLRARDLLERSYVFIVDEPDDADAGLVRELHELVHDADPGLRLLVTRESSARAMRGSVDVWVPNINPERFHPADVARERRTGRETWWYPSITTFAPYPDLFIDELRPTPRALGWLAWRSGVSGFLYWSATHWHEVDDPYRDSATYREPDAVGNGDGVLLYPGAPVGRPGEPSPSVRLLQLRDGIEDHDLLAMATCSAPVPVRRRIARLVRSLAPSLTHVEPTDIQLDALRSALFAALERPVAARAARLHPDGTCSR